MATDWQAALRRNRFAVVGRAGMDLYADPPGTRVEAAARFVTALGGSAANIAAALARQGAAVSLLTRVAADAVGDFCLAELARYGVDTGLVVRAAAGARNSLAVTETRAEDCRVVLYRDGAADLTLSREDAARLDAGGLGALIVTGTALAAGTSRAAVAEAAARARAAGALVLLDIDYRPASWPSAEEAAVACERLAWGADAVIGNVEEFALLAGSAAGGRAFARALVEAGAAFAVYKQGEAGCETFSADGAFRTPAFAVAALKPMGAGDGFMAGLVAALAQGAPLAESVRRGAATAAIIVSGLGCAPASPTRAELDGFLSQRTADAHPAA
jgi:5-dehydro-2-deoxygluconokinase